MDNYGSGHVTLPWKNNEHRTLPYKNEPFNDQDSVTKWKEQGHTHKYYTGDMYDMQNRWEPWIDISVYEKIFGWKQLSWSFYKMTTGVILPEHVDTFKRYKTLHPDHPGTIYRAVVFLEDWQPGHVLTLGDKQIEQWVAGDYVYWRHDTLHLAANIGFEDRYTLQLTGFNVED